MKVDIQRTIEAARGVIADKAGKKTFYSPDLKEAIIAASEVVGPTAFGTQTGISRSLIYQWKSSIKNKKRKRPECDFLESPSHPNKEMTPETWLGVRELVVQQDPALSVQKKETAVIRSGSQLEIEVPLEILTPNWICGILRALECRDGGDHV